MKKFAQYGKSYDHPKTELETLKFWKENDVFAKSVETRDPKKPFSFYEGPPTANGKPGIHHVMARTLKDLVCRYKTMKGYRVARKAGWDTHGLPVEIEVEKALGIKNKSEIPEFGVEKYNAACRESVFRYKDLWEEMTDRMGYWVDLEHPYITCDNDYIESVWWSLKQLFDRGLLFKDYKIVPQCPRSETALSSHELALGYKTTKDPSVYVLFKRKGSEDDYFLVWTTTPWTLISNVALAVGADVDYAKIKREGKTITLARARLETLFPEGDYEIVEETKGAELERAEYEQLLPFVKPDKKAFYVVVGDFVSTEDGSGVVHIAPAFGQDDYELSKKYDLPMLQPVGRNGKFTDEVEPYKGQFVKDADPEIIKRLKIEGKLFRKETIEHSYPFSWRFDNVPVIYYANESWFIKTTSVADRMVELNKEIAWQPPEVGAGRFGNWLAENKDWALSRERFWATPLPIWIAEDGDMFAVGSVEELREGIYVEDGKKTPVKDIENLDLHKPHVDRIVFEKNGKTYRRTPELIDVWYDSGAMPFAQWHYPFENKELFEANYPADFICEGIDQTRGWFYTLHAIGAMLFDDVAYKNILVNELVLDEKGVKMSKSRGNAVDPFALFEKYGADATRWYIVANNQPWRPTLFNEKDLADAHRKFFGTLSNTYSFFAMYANIDGFDGSEAFVPYEERIEIDRWIVSALNAAVATHEAAMDRYDPTKAARALNDFVIDKLSNWYVRRSRRRFWKSEMNREKLAAYQTLYECLATTAKLLAPLAPFYAEDLYRTLNATTGSESAESVHLADYPAQTYRDEALEAKMEAALRAVVLARAARTKANLKVRQPLRSMVVAADEETRAALEATSEVIKEEINVKELKLVEDASALATKEAKPNFKALGPKYGKKVNAVAEAIRGFGADEIARLERGEAVEFETAGAKSLVEPADVEIASSEAEGWAIEADRDVTVGLDARLDDELIAEGLVREFVNRVQNMRKDAGFEVVDRVVVSLKSSDAFADAVRAGEEYVRVETLADEIVYDGAKGTERKTWKIGDEEIEIAVAKA
jgi:isoleucyl-tRNA synthetase